MVHKKVAMTRALTHQSAQWAQKFFPATAPADGERAAAIFLRTLARRRISQLMRQQRRNKNALLPPPTPPQVHDRNLPWKHMLTIKENSKLQQHVHLQIKAKCRLKSAPVAICRQ